MKQYPYWWEGNNSFFSEKIEVPSQVDVLIIGGGYTGLCAALATSELGANTLVIDKANPGEGASTRNGGMFGAHPRVSWDKVRNSYGESVADKIFEEAPVALTFVKDLIRKNKIKCDFNNSGRIQLAWTKDHFTDQKKMVENISTKSNTKVDILEKRDLCEHICTEKYFGGVHFSEHCSLNPKKFQDGLINLALSKGVKISSHAEAKRIDRNNNRWTVFLNGGRSINTSKIIMATNGYTGNNFPWFFRRVFPIPSYIVVTEEISDDFMRNHLPSNKMMVETRAKHSYFRKSPDNKRIIFGGRASMVNIPDEKAVSRLKDTMIEIWPKVEKIPIAYSWSGNTGFTFNQLPHVGQINGINYAMGFCGSGTVLAPYLGYKVGYQALGDKRGETAYSLTNLKLNPFNLLSKPYFLNILDIWTRLKFDR